MDKEIRYFVNGYEMLLYLSGDREERKSVDCFELQDFESEEEAVAAARDFISEHKNAVNDQKHGIGCDDPDFAEECDFQVVDTAGVLVGGVNDWCRAANLILVPMLPSTRDMEPTLRTLDIVRESGTGAKAYVIVNNFYAYGTLDRQLVEYLEGEEVPIIAKIPRAVALSRAAAAGVSVAEYDPKSHVVAPIELLADSVLNEEEKNNG